MKRRTQHLGSRHLLAAVACLAVAAAAASAAEEKLDTAPFKNLRTYEVGKNSGDCQKVAAMVVAAHANTAMRAAIEKELAAILADPKATTDAKRFVCRQLLTIGTAASVPALAPLLTDKDLSHMGRYALERMQCPEAGKAIRDALPAVKGRLLIGIVNSLGERRDTQAVPAITRFLKGSDQELAGAAARALGKIAGDPSAKALAAARATAKERLRQTADDAYLRCADAFLAAGDKAKAKTIYTELYKPDEKPNIRAGALRGLIAVGGDEAIALIMKPLMSDDLAMQTVAVSYIRDVPGSDATRAFAAQLPKLSPKAQVLVLGALATRADKAAAPAVTAAASHADEAVQVAAIKALAALGDAANVPLLVKASTSTKKPVADAAASTLTLLTGDGVNAAIVAQIGKADPKGRAALVRTLTARHASDAVPQLLKLAQDPDDAVRKEAFTAIGKLADVKTLPDLVSLMVTAKAGPAMRAAERAVVTVARNIEDNDARVAALLTGMAKASGENKAALLRVVGRFGGDKALAAVRAGVADADPKIQDAAIRTLADWPDAAPADDLAKLMRTTKSQVHRVLALRGYVRVLALPSDRPIQDVLKRYDEVMKLATSTADKKLILAAMAELRHPAVLRAIGPYLTNPELKAEAEAAMNKVTKAMKQPAKLTASHNAGKARNATDGDAKTRWDTGGAMSGGEWFMVELPVEQVITKLTLDARGSNGDYPRGYEIYISRDGKSWGKPIATGKGTGPLTQIALKPTFGRFVKILQTGKSSGLFWSIHELKIDTKNIEIK